MTPIAHQAPLSMGFSRQEYWSGLPCPSPGDFPDPGIKPGSPVLQARKAQYNREGLILNSSWICLCDFNPHPAAFVIVCVLCLVAQLCPALCNPMDCSPPGSSVYGDSPGKNTGVGCHALLQGIFPTQRLNPGLPHCRWILYHLSHQSCLTLCNPVASTVHGIL